MSFNLLANYAIDVAEPYVIWGTVAIAGALVLAGLILLLVDYKFTKNGIFKKVVKIAFYSFFVYALVMGIAVLIMEIAKHYDPAYLEDKWVSKDIVPYMFIPTVITLGLALLSFAGLFVVSLKYPKAKKIYSIIAGTVCAVSLVVTLVLIAVYFGNNIVGDGYYTEGYGELNSVALYVSAAILVAGAIVAAFVIDKDKSAFDTRTIAFAGVAVALSFALSYVKLWEMPQGGSVTLASMLPVMLFAYVYGIKKGLIVGLIYGILQAVQDPYIVHPAQFLLDYPVAFAMVGFAGAFKGVKIFENSPQIKFALSAAVAAVLRFVSHVLSGVFAFGAYALDLGKNNFFLYSLAYNSFVFIDLLIVIVAGVILFSSKGFVNELSKFSPVSDGKPE